MPPKFTHRTKKAGLTVSMIVVERQHALHTQSPSSPSDKSNILSNGYSTMNKSRSTLLYTRRLSSKQSQGQLSNVLVRCRVKCHASLSNCSAGDIAHEFKHKRLEPYHIQLAIRTDAPLNTLVKETYADEPGHEMLPPALPVPSVPKLSESGGEL